MHLALTLLFVFGAVAGGLLSLSAIWKMIWRRDQTRFSERLDEEFLKAQPLANSTSSLFKSLDVIAREIGPGTKLGFGQQLERFVLHAGVGFSLRTLVYGSAMLGILLAFPLAIWQHNAWLALPAFALGAAIPPAYIWFKVRARLDALRRQLPDAFDTMGRSLRGGQTLEQALQTIAQEFGPPLGPEFSYCFEQQNLGLPRETAYRELAERVGLVEIQIMVVAILVQQQSGGNLAELLDKLSIVVRERFRMTAKIRTLTAEGKFQSVLLMALPPLMLVILFIVKKSYILVLFDHPWLLVTIAVMQLVGAFWIHRIANFRY